MPRPKQHLVILQHPHADVCAEGLRCALGLTLDGARVTVVILDSAQEALQQLKSHAPAFVRPVQYLTALGHDIFAVQQAHDDIELLTPEEFSDLFLQTETCTTW